MKLKLNMFRTIIGLFFVMPVIYAQKNEATFEPIVQSPVASLYDHYLKQSNQHFYFEENKGQVSGADAGKVLYTYHSNDLTIFLLKGGLAYQFTKAHYPKGYDAAVPDIAKTRQKVSSVNEIQVETYRMNVDLVGANPYATMVVEGKSSDYHNYYQSNTLGVYNYKKITYKDVYPNIDWVVYKSGNSVKYDFVVRPGGDPANIKLSTEYVEDQQLNHDGSFTMRNRMGAITEQKPVSYQDNREIETKFNIEGGQISFEINHYDPLHTLIIDPQLAWSTYYGDTGDDMGHSVSVDKNGNVYLAGFTQSQNNIASGGYQNSFVFQNGPLNFNNFLVKFNKEGVRQWGTYYGAIANTAANETSSATDLWGNIYLASTTSQTTGVTQNGHQNTFGGGFFDAYLVKFDSMGNRLWATYYGGSGNDMGYGCATDPSGAVYLCGTTNSENNISFNGYKNTYGGDIDPFLVKFSKDGERLWATYYGGSNSDQGYSCAVDGSGSVYLAGNAYSNNGIAFQGHQNTYGGAYLVKFNSAGARQWGTYYGLNYNDVGSACATDGSGAVYLAGTTFSASNIAFNGFQNTYGGGANDAFLVKFNSSGVRQWGTYYGGNGNTDWWSDYGRSCSVSSNGAVYLAGNSSSQNGIAYEGYQDTLGGGPADAFLVKFNSQTGERLWGTYFGGENGEFGYGCASDDVTGAVYLCGMTKTQNGLVLGGHQEVFGGAHDDAFLVKLRDNCQEDKNPIAILTATPATAIADGTSVTFNVAISNQGLFPDIKWKKNNILITSASGLSWTGVAGVDFQHNDQISVKITSNSFCADIDTVTSNVITIQQPLGIGDLKVPDDFSIYPNPSRQNISIQGLKKRDHIDIVNILGQKVGEVEVVSNNCLLLDLKTYYPGMYIFKFTRSSELSWSTRVIKLL